MADEIDHEEVKDISGGTIPFNFDELHYDADPETGEALIDCNDCGNASAESEWHWIDTDATRLEGGGMEVRAVHMECPICGGVTVFR